MTNTEKRLERYRDADRWPAEESIAAMLDNKTSALFAVRQVAKDLALAAAEAANRLKSGHGRIIYTGAGASGRIAVQDGVELFPTFSWPKERLVYLMAGGEAALTRSIEGAEDDARAGEVAILDLNADADDVVIALAASGHTPYTIAAAATARKLGACTITFANNPGAPLLDAGSINILLDTGPEFLAGSTRMTAGTAQKIALNILSTQTMMELGRIHDGWMVDVVAANVKLVDRSKRILMSLTGIDADLADELWDKSGGNLKLAVLMADGMSADAAGEALEAAQGRLGLARKTR